MRICSRSLNVGSATLVPVSQWRVLSCVFGVVLWCLAVTSLQEGGPDIPNMAICTGKLFHVTFGSHPVYGRPDFSLELSAGTEAADDQIPLWLSFNSTSRSLSGVPLPGDESTTRLTITAKCLNIFAHTGGCSGHSKHVFQLTVSRCCWSDSQVSWLPVASDGENVATMVPAPNYGSSHVTFVDAVCEGERVVASLVLCSTSEQFTSRDRFNLLLHLSDFLAIPVGLISMELSSSGLLAAVNKAFHMVSAGPGSDDCNLNQNIEMLWWLPCSTVKHLGDFIRVLQHNVDGGRLRQEIGRPIVGWYVASSSPLLSRPSRRRRAAGYRTAALTPVLSPLKPTSLVGSAQAESAVVSSTAASSRPTVLQATDDQIIVPESSRQIQTDVVSPDIVSSFVALFPGYPADTARPPSSSPALSSLHVTSSSSLMSTPTVTSQQPTQSSRTARMWETLDTSTSQSTTGAVFSYFSAQQVSDSRFIQSRQTVDVPASFDLVLSDLLSTPDLVTSFIQPPSDLSNTPSLPTSHIPSDLSSTPHLPTSFVRVPSDLASTSLTPTSFARIPPDLSLYSHLPSSFTRVLAMPTSGRPVRQSLTDTATSSMRSDIPQATPRPDISPLSLASSRTLSLSLPSSGALPLSLASSRTLPLSLASSGALPLSLASSGTLPLSLASSGALPLSLASSGALPLSLASSGALSLSLASSGTLPLSLASSGTLPLSLASSGALSLSLASSGALSLSLASSGALPLSLASSGTLPLSLVSSGTLPLSLASSGTLERFASGLFLPDNAGASVSLLYLSSALTDWLPEYVTESSSSLVPDRFSFDHTQTSRPPPHVSFPEARLTQDTWSRPSQMSDSGVLLTSAATLHPESAYLVISRDVEVLTPLFTSNGSVLTIDSSTDVFPSAPDATSVTPDIDWRSNYHSLVYSDAVWGTGFHEHSHIPTLRTTLSSVEQSPALDHHFLPRLSPVSELPTFLHSPLTLTAPSGSGSVTPLPPLCASDRSASASEILADRQLHGKSRDMKTTSMMAEWDLVQSGVPATIHSQVDDFSNTISTPSVSASDTTSSVYLPVDDDTVNQSIVAEEDAGGSTAAPWPGTAGAGADPTTITTPLSSSAVLFFTSAATKRPRTRTTTPVVTRARTTTATTTTITTATTKQRSQTTKRPAGRKPSTHKARPTTHRTTHMPTQRTTQRTTERTTTEWSDEDDIYPDHGNNRPYVQRSIKVIRADQGKLLEFMVPHDVFYDIEDGDTRHLSLSLELPSNQVLPDNFWLYIEPTSQVIKALALHEDMDVKNMTVTLVARDKQGQAAADYITLQINDTPRTSFTHVFRMKFAVAFLQFMHSRRNITELLERIGSFFGDHGAGLMTVLEVRPGSFVMSWTNNSLTGATCQLDVIRQLYTHMVRRDGTVRQTFSRHIGRHLHLKEVQLQPWGSCVPAPVATTPAPTTTPTTAPSSSTASTSTVLVSEVKGHGFSVWAHVILPVLIAVLVFILIILVVIVCNRKRRQRQTTLSAEKEAISTDGNPVVFPGESEAEDLSPKAVAPLISPAADLQPNQNLSAGSSQVKNNLNRDQERARKSRDNREQEWLNKDTQIHEQGSDRDWSRNFHGKHARDSGSGRRRQDPDRTSRVSACSTLSWDRPNNHYLEEEAGSRSSTLKSSKSVSSDKRHGRSPPPYWHYQTDPPPYRMPPPYLSNNTTHM